MCLDVDLIILPATRRVCFGENDFLLLALVRFRSATLRIIAISFGEIAPLPPLAIDFGDLESVSVRMTDFFGAKERRLDDFENLLLVLLLDLVDFNAEGPAEPEEGFAHCIMVFRRNLLFSCSEPNPDGLPCLEMDFSDLVATVNAGRPLLWDLKDVEDPAFEASASLLRSSSCFVVAFADTATAFTSGTAEACLDVDVNTDREALLSFALLASLTTLLLLLLRTLLTALTTLLLLLL